MGVYNLNRLFQPASIAVICGRRESVTAGYRLGKALTAGGFGGEVHLVGSKSDGLKGSRSCRSILDLKDAVDLAIIPPGLSDMGKAIDECGKARVGSVLIVSPLDGCTEPERRRILEIVERTSRSHGVRFLGPGCTGLYSRKAMMKAGFGSRMPVAGKLAFISQSGSISSAVLDLSIREKIGFSYFIHTGEMPDVDTGDLIDYIGSDPDVSSIVLYAERLTGLRKFMSAARAVSRIKPIVVLKAGRSLKDTSAASMPISSDTVYEAAFKRAGMVQVKTFEALFDCAEILAKQPRPAGSGLAIVSSDSGPGLMGADALADYGLKPVELSKDTKQKMDSFLASSWGRTNPVRVPLDMLQEHFQSVMQVCIAAREIDGLLVMFSAQSPVAEEKTARDIVEILAQRPFPVMTSWLGGSRTEGRALLNQAGIPTFDSPERAVRAFMNLHQYAENRRLLQEIPPSPAREPEYDKGNARRIIQENLNSGNGIVPKIAANDLAAAYGLPSGTSIGGENKINRVLAVHKGIELCAGSRKDPDFGPVILFGMGGKAGDVLEDRHVELPPINRLLARRLMSGTKAYHLLQCVGGIGPDGLAAIEEILVGLSQITTDFPEIEVFELNPLVYFEGGLYADSAHIVLGPAKVAAPNHMVISAYPSQYEATVDIDSLGELLIRPIRPEDAPLMIELFESMSPQSVYFRFFSPLKTLPLHMLARLTQIDYDRDIALVALKDTGSGERMLGAARVILGKDQQSGECAIKVGDEWHGKGIAAELLSRCLIIAKERHLKKVWGKALSDNTKMIALAKKLDFKIKRGMEWGECELSKEL